MRNECGGTVITFRAQDSPGPRSTLGVAASWCASGCLPVEGPPASLRSSHPRPQPAAGLFLAPSVQMRSPVYGGTL